MKIGIFTECYKPVMNGVAVSIDTFRKALEEKGHEVFIFAPDHPEASADPYVFRFPAISDKKKRLYPITFPSLSLMKTYLPEDIVKDLDIIHAQHMFTAGRLARYVANKYEKPLVYTYHTMLSDYTHYVGFLAPIVGLYLKNMTKRFCNSCDQLIAPSNPMKKILKGYGVKASVEVIMTGINPKAYKRIGEIENKQLREKYGINPSDKILLYLSRIAKEKNIDLLFRSFVEIRKEYPNCHLIMAGGGPEEGWAHERVKELGIEKRVTFTGMLPKEEANKMFSFADLFTFPSFTETQGIVVAEAMAAGTPPVAVNKMGPTDLIHDGEDGYLTKLTEKDFSSKIIKLLKDDNLRNKFSENGLKRVKEFSTEASTKKLLTLYNKIVGQKLSPKS